MKTLYVLSRAVPVDFDQGPLFVRLVSLWIPFQPHLTLNYSQRRQ